MAEEKSNIPLLDPSDIPEFLQSEHWFEVDTTGLYLDFQKPYTPPRWTMSHNGIPFAKLGDLHVIQGKAGHGKTALMTQFMATLLCGRFGNLRCELKQPATVLYIDTEMSEDDTIATKNRVCTMAGIPCDQPNDKFKIVRLRETEEANVRWKQVLKVIYEVRPTVCFLDGALDMVNDYNNQIECQPIIRMCMMLVTHYDMSMWCVLHENPQTDKMVGTLGSIMQRKVTEAFSVKKHKHDKTANMPDIFFEVLQPKSRGRDQDDWYFEITNAESWGMPVELDNGVRVDDPVTREMIESNERFKAYNWTSSGARYTDLEKFLMAQGVTSKRQIKNLFDVGLEKGIIYKNGKKYFYNGLKEMENDAEEHLPFEKSDNEAVPF